MAWKEIKNNVWTPNEGDEITGVYVGSEKPEGAHSALYYLNTKDKGTLGVWGCAIIDNLLGQVKEGELLRITYQGKKKNSRGQDMRVYKVEVYEEERKRAPAIIPLEELEVV